MANRFVQCAGCGGSFAFHHPGDENWKPNFRQHGFIEINGLYFSTPKCFKKWQAEHEKSIEENFVQMISCQAKELPFDENNCCISCGHYEADPPWYCPKCGEYIPDLPEEFYSEDVSQQETIN